MFSRHPPSNAGNHPPNQSPTNREKRPAPLSPQPAHNTLASRPKNDAAFDHHRGFREHKRVKLEEQDAALAARLASRSPAPKPQIFRSETMTCVGHTIPPSADLRKIVIAHGGKWAHNPRAKTLKTIIASGMSVGKLESLPKRVKVIKPEWISECVHAGRLVGWDKWTVSADETQTTLEGWLAPRDQHHPMNPLNRQPEDNPWVWQPEEAPRNRQDIPRNRQLKENLQNRYPREIPQVRYSQEDPQIRYSQENPQNWQSEENQWNWQPEEDPQPEEIPQNRQIENSRNWNSKENWQNQEPEETPRDRKLEENPRNRKLEKNPRSLQPVDYQPKENPPVRNLRKNLLNRQIEEKKILRLDSVQISVPGKGFRAEDYTNFVKFPSKKIPASQKKIPASSRKRIPTSSRKKIPASSRTMRTRSTLMAPPSSSFQSSQTGLQSSQKGLQSSQKDLQSSQKDLQSLQKDLQPSKKDLQSSQKDLQSSQIDLQSSQIDLQSSQIDLPSIPQALSPPPVMNVQTRTATKLYNSDSRGYTTALDSFIKKGGRENPVLVQVPAHPPVTPTKPRTGASEGHSGAGPPSSPSSPIEIVPPSQLDISCFKGLPVKMRESYLKRIPSMSRVDVLQKLDLDAKPAGEDKSLKNLQDSVWGEEAEIKPWITGPPDTLECSISLWNTLDLSQKEVLWKDAKGDQAQGRPGLEQGKLKQAIWSQDEDEKSSRYQKEEWEQPLWPQEEEQEQVPWDQIHEERGQSLQRQISKRVPVLERSTIAGPSSLGHANFNNSAISGKSNFPGLNQFTTPCEIPRPRPMTRSTRSLEPKVGIEPVLDLNGKDISGWLFEPSESGGGGLERVNFQYLDIQSRRVEIIKALERRRTYLDRKNKEKVQDYSRRKLYTFAIKSKVAREKVTLHLSGGNPVGLGKKDHSAAQNEIRAWVSRYTDAGPPPEDVAHLCDWLEGVTMKEGLPAKTDSLVNFLQRLAGNKDWWQETCHRAMETAEKARVRFCSNRE